jgi:hypothetical protein
VRRGVREQERRRGGAGVQARRGRGGTSGRTGDRNRAEPPAALLVSFPFYIYINIFHVPRHNHKGGFLPCGIYTFLTSIYV